MFKIEKNDEHLSFNVEKADSVFGDGTRILFWVDLKMGALQRGRQEFIPLSTISSFQVSNDGNDLLCDLESAEMTLYQGSHDEKNQIAEAVKMLNDYCGIDER